MEPPGSGTASSSARPKARPLPMAEALGLAVTPWGPDRRRRALRGPRWDGRRRTRSRVAANRHRFSDRNMKIAGEVSAIARGTRPVLRAGRDRLGMGRGPHGTIPIVGPGPRPSSDDSLGVIDTALTPEMLTRLDAVSKIEPGFPHDFLARPTMARTLRGDLGDKLISGFEKPLARKASCAIIPAPPPEVVFGRGGTEIRIVPQ